MATTPPKPPDNPMVKYLLLYAVIAVVGVAVGDAISDDALSEIVKQLTLIGPILFILVQRQEDTKKELAKGLNGDLDRRIEAAVERVLERWTRPQ